MYFAQPIPGQYESGTPITSFTQLEGGGGVVTMVMPLVSSANLNNNINVVNIVPKVAASAPVLMPANTTPISEVPPQKSSTAPSQTNGIKASTVTGQGRGGTMSISVVNVVCNFKLRCHVNLRQLARGSVNTVHKPEKNIVEMELRRPRCNAKIYPSGKVFALGTTTESDALKAARRIARRVQKSGHPQARFSGFHINNMMSTSWVPFGVRLKEIGELGPPFVFEPELGNRLHVNFQDIRTSVNVSPNGQITVFANSRSRILEGLKRIYPTLFKFRCLTHPGVTGGSSISASTAIPSPVANSHVSQKETNLKEEPVAASNCMTVGQLPQPPVMLPTVNPNPCPSTQQSPAIYGQINLASAFVHRSTTSSVKVEPVQAFSSSHSTACVTTTVPSGIRNTPGLGSLPFTNSTSAGMADHKVDTLMELEDFFDSL